MKIVAIGGGEIGRPGTSIETEAIDREIIRLSGKTSPSVLFLPTASHDSQGYVEVVEKYFGERLGCTVSTLLLWGRTLSFDEIEGAIMSADIVYVGGGNTKEMITLWNELGVHALLRKAAEKGTVLSGVSAGAVCWFKETNSDSEKMINPDADYIRIDCLNFVPLFVCPHFDAEVGREASLRNMLKDGGSTIGIDNCAALEIIDDRYRVITSKPEASAYRCYWEGAEFVKKNLNEGAMVSVQNLLQT